MPGLYYTPHFLPSHLTLFIESGRKVWLCLTLTCSGGVILSLCREVFPREHLSTERIVQHTVLLWRSSHLIPDIISQSERSLGTAPTQVQDDPSYRLEGLEEDEITADRQRNNQRNRDNSDSLSQPVPSGYGLGENIHFMFSR